MAKKQQTVLVVEDEDFMMEALTKLLKEEGFLVLKARDGQEGLDKALAEQPDLILLDIIMPRLDGIEMLRKLRQDNWGRKALVALLTNLNTPERIRQGQELGADEYLVKSDWTLNGIVAQAKELLKHNK